MTEDDEWGAIGERLRRTRLIAGMSQAELGKLVGLDRTMVAKIEAGIRRIGALELTQISGALRVPIGYLLEPLPPILSRRGSVVDEDFDSAVARESGRLEIELTTWLGDLRQLVELGMLRPLPLLVSKRPVDSEESARETALWVREVLGHQCDPIDSLVELCERAGQFVLVTELPGEGASAIDGDIAAAVVSLSVEPGRRRATRSQRSSCCPRKCSPATWVWAGSREASWSNWQPATASHGRSRSASQLMLGYLISMRSAQWLGSGPHEESSWMHSAGLHSLICRRFAYRPITRMRSWTIGGRPRSAGREGGGVAEA